MDGGKIGLPSGYDFVAIFNVPVISSEIAFSSMFTAVAS